MLKQNDSTPPTVRAKVVATADGSAVTSGVAAYHLHGSTRAAVGGSAATHIANGIWEYTPTQGETNYTSYGIEFYHADAVAGGPIVEMFTDTKIVSDLNDFDGTGATLHSDYDAAKSAYTGTPPTAEAIVNEWETQAAADPTGFKVNVMEWKGTTPGNIVDTDKIPVSMQHAATDVITAASLNADAVTEIKSGLSTFDGTGATLDSAYDAAKTAASSTALGLVSDAVNSIGTLCTAIVEDTGTSLPATLATILEDTADLQANQGSWATATGYAVPGDEMNLADDAITSAKYDESTAYPLAKVDGIAPITAFQYIAAMCAGKVTGAGTAEEKFYGLNGTTERVRIAGDADGNRDTITYDP